MTFDDNLKHADHKDLAADEIDIELGKLQARHDELLASLAKCEVVDDDTAGKAATLISMLSRLAERAVNEGKIVAEPYDEAVTVVKSKVGRFNAPLENGVIAIKGKIEAHRKTVRQKIAAQQAEQAAALGPVITAEIPRAVKAPSVRSDFGGSISDRIEHDFEIVDYALLPETILKHADVRAAIIKVCKIQRKITPEIPGVVITERAASTTRKK